MHSANNGLAVPVENLDYKRLAQFRFSGGNIQNVVLNAAFRAASRKEHRRVTMKDLFASAKDEFEKLDRPLRQSDFEYIEPPIEEAVA